jgi:putative redox protein
MHDTARRRTVRRERLRIPGATGEHLAAIMDTPPDGPRGWAVIAHCFTCGKDSLAASRIARGLLGQGIGVVRFDVTGLGESSGDFATTGFSSNIEDLVVVTEHLTAAGREPRLLVGHSLGGAAAIAAAVRLPQIRAVATVAAPCDPGHLLGLLGDVVPAIERDGVAEIEIAGRPVTLRREFLDDLSGQPQVRRLRRLRRPLLVLHSPVDEVVSIDEAQRIFTAARHPKSFVALDGADHLLTRAADAEYAARVIAAWAGRYLEPA